MPTKKCLEHVNSHEPQILALVNSCQCLKVLNKSCLTNNSYPTRQLSLAEMFAQDSTLGQWFSKFFL